VTAFFVVNKVQEWPNRVRRPQ